MIEIWKNKLTENPSIQVGSITIDLGKETLAQKALFELVTNHPDTDVGPSMRGPVTDEIAEAFELVLAEEIQKYRPKKKMTHSLKISVDSPPRLRYS